jgi:hypothetical protein
MPGMSGLKIITSGRGQGKTHQLVQWLLENPDNRVIVVPHSGYVLAAKMVLTKLEGLAHLDRVVVAGSIKGAFPPGTEIAVDGLEHLLSHLLQGAVSTVTLANPRVTIQNLGIDTRYA